MNYLVQNEVDESAIFECIEQVSDDEGAHPAQVNPTSEPVQMDDVAMMGDLLALEDGPCVEPDPSDVSVPPHASGYIGRVTEPEPKVPLNLRDAGRLVKEPKKRQYAQTVLPFHKDPKSIDYKKSCPKGARPF